MPESESNANCFLLISGETESTSDWTKLYTLDRKSIFCRIYVCTKMFSTDRHSSRRWWWCDRFKNHRDDIIGAQSYLRLTFCTHRVRFVGPPTVLNCERDTFASWTQSLSASSFLPVGLSFYLWKLDHKYAISLISRTYACRASHFRSCPLCFASFMDFSRGT